MKTLLIPAVLIPLAAAPVFAQSQPQRPAGQPAPAAAAAAGGSWTGFITDTNCGKAKANRQHTQDCVEECVHKGGKVQLLNEADGKLYTLEGSEKVRVFTGSKVMVKGTLDAATNTITVKSFMKATAAY